MCLIQAKKEDFIIIDSFIMLPDGRLEIILTPECSEHYKKIISTNMMFERKFGLIHFEKEKL